jgi:hypothetical protein
LHHPPGHAQADFGEASVSIGGAEQTAHFFAFDLPHRDACFVRAFPAATADAWADGHVQAFAFFGRVPQSVLYNNDRCLVARILPGEARKLWIGVAEDLIWASNRDPGSDWTSTWDAVVGGHGLEPKGVDPRCRSTR